MHADPAQWSPLEVREYFVQHAAAALPQFASELEFAAEPLCMVLGERRIMNGELLLRYVDRRFLERQGFEHRAIIAIQECLALLREQSLKTYDICSRERQEPGLTVVQQASGGSPPRKKRRIVPQLVSQEEQIPAQQDVVSPTPEPPSGDIDFFDLSSPVQISTYKPEPAVDINNIFFGSTRIGSEIIHDSCDQQRGNTITAEDDRLISFIATTPLNNAGMFVARHVQRALRCTRPISVNIDNRHAAFSIPYRPACSKNPSAVVVRFSGLTGIVASREKIIGTGQDIHIPALQVGQLHIDGLLYKHVASDEESLVTVDDASQYSLTDDDSDDGSSIASESSGTPALTREELQEILEMAEALMQEHWRQHQLPKLESKKARQVWKQMKQSKTLRDALIASSLAEVERLQERLRLLKNEYHAIAWTDKSEVEARAGGLQPTIEQILFNEWRIDVYNRRRQPDGPLRVGRNAQNSGNVHRRAGSGSMFVVDDHDRMSICSEPTEMAYTAAASKSEHEATVTHNGLSSPLSDADDLILSEQKPGDTPSILSLPPSDLDNFIDDLSDGVDTAGGVVAPPRDRSSSPVVLALASSPAAEMPSVKSPRPGASHIHQDRSTPLEMTAHQLEHERFEDLVNARDRIRILLKLLYNIGAQWRSEAFHRFGHSSSNTFWAAFQAFGQDMIENTHDTIANNGNMAKLVYFYLAFYYARASISPSDYQSHDLTAALEARDDLEQFKHILRTALLRKDGKLFNKDKAPMNQTVVLDLSSDSDAKATVKSTAKVVKRKAVQVPVLTPTKKSEAAHRRHERAAKISSQGETSKELAVNGNGQDPLIEVNVSRKKGLPAIHIDSFIASAIKPHQIDGVRFLWREITADTDDINGALLAHTMGLGKTMQTIATLLTLTQAGRSTDKQVSEQLPGHLLPTRAADGEKRLRIIVICPSALVENWGTELRQWDQKGIIGEIFKLDSSVKPVNRLPKIQAWAGSGGVLLISHEMYRTLVLGVKMDAQQAKLVSSLLSGTANVAVLDEAQSIKNKDAKVNQAIQLIQAKARIALTGTPLSNAIDEIYELITWVAPGYFESRGVFNTKYATPIKLGLYADAAPREIRQMLKWLKILIAEIAPKVNRATSAVIKDELKPKFEFTLTIALTEKQELAYKRMLVAINDLKEIKDISGTTILAWLDTFALLIAHPAAFRSKLLERCEQPVKGAKLGSKAAKQTKANIKAETPAPSESPDDISDDDEQAPGADQQKACFSAAVTKAIIGDIDHDTDPMLAAKTQLTLEIVLKSIEAGDRILVFSCRLRTLDYLAKLFIAESIAFARIDGSVKAADRMTRIAGLNEGHYDVMLISTKAGGVGLNMQAANRVVIVDSDFNPSNEEQAIGRAYRLGQTKPVFVYRFVAGGTFEDNLDNLQRIKRAMAERVVDGKNYIRNARRSLDAWLVDPRPPTAKDITGVIGNDPGVLDDILEAQQSLLKSMGKKKASFVYSVSTTQHNQIEAVDEKLDDAEMQEVNETIEQNKVTRRSTRLASRGPATTAA